MFCKISLLQTLRKLKANIGIEEIRRAIIGNIVDTDNFFLIRSRDKFLNTFTSDIYFTFDIKGTRTSGQNMDLMSMALYMLSWLLNIVFLRFGLVKLTSFLFPKVNQLTVSKNELWFFCQIRMNDRTTIKTRITNTRTFFVETTIIGVAAF